MATIPPPGPGTETNPGADPQVQPSTPAPEISPPAPDFDQPAPDPQPNAIPGDPGQQETG